LRVIKTNSLVLPVFVSGNETKINFVEAVERVEAWIETKKKKANGSQGTYVSSGSFMFCENWCVPDPEPELGGWRRGITIDPPINQPTTMRPYFKNW